MQESYCERINCFDNYFCYDTFALLFARKKVSIVFPFFLYHIHAFNLPLIYRNNSYHILEKLKKKYKRIQKNIKVKKL